MSADERDCEPTIESLREQVRRLSGLVNDARRERDQVRADLTTAREREKGCESALIDERTTSEMWEAWAGSLRDALDGLVRATRGHLGEDHPLITRAVETMGNG